MTFNMAKFMRDDASKDVIRLSPHRKPTCDEDCVPWKRPGIDYGSVQNKDARRCFVARQNLRDARDRLVEQRIVQDAIGSCDS